VAAWENGPGSGGVRTALRRFGVRPQHPVNSILERAQTRAVRGRATRPAPGCARSGGGTRPVAMQRKLKARRCGPRASAHASQRRSSAVSPKNRRVTCNARPVSSRAPAIPDTGPRSPVEVRRQVRRDEETQHRSGLGDGSPQRDRMRSRSPRLAGMRGWKMGCVESVATAAATASPAPSAASARHLGQSARPARVARCRRRASRLDLHEQVCRGAAVHAQAGQHATASCFHARTDRHSARHGLQGRACDVRRPGAAREAEDRAARFERQWGAPSRQAGTMVTPPSSGTEAASPSLRLPV